MLEEWYLKDCRRKAVQAIWHDPEVSKMDLGMIINQLLYELGEQDKLLRWWQREAQRRDSPARTE